MTAALAWAKRLGSDDLAWHHLLLGLLDEEEGHPARLLASQQVALETARNVALQLAPPPVPNASPHAEDPSSFGSVRQLLHEARLLALDQGERTANSLHLLLTLLDLAPDLAEGLRTVGFDSSPIRAELLEAKGPPLVLDEPLLLPATSDIHDAGRILDANANRAREALRVLEDFARFVLDDAFLCGLAKGLRHELTAALGHLPEGVLVSARATEADVGTDLHAPAEAQRSSLAAVLAANASRLAEALRALEEYGKLVSPEFGLAIKRLRYRGYTLEKALSAGSRAKDRLAGAQLYLLVGRSTCTASLEWTIAEAVAGGVDLIQIREKGIPDREWLQLARRAKSACRKAGVPLIVNDRPDIARWVEAEGVHLGQDDVDVADARRILGPEAWVGVSTHNLEQARAALLAGADYLGVGPTFPSDTKKFDEFPGLPFVSAVAALTSRPAFAIGGIGPNNIQDVAAAGLRRVAVGRAISAAEEPRTAAELLKAALQCSPSSHSARARP